jgi:hypothetical protein
MIGKGTISTLEDILKMVEYCKIRAIDDFMKEPLIYSSLE